MAGFEDFIIDSLYTTNTPLSSEVEPRCNMDIRAERISSGAEPREQPEERQLLHPASADTKVAMVAQPTPRSEKKSQLWLRHELPHSPEAYSVL